MRFMSILTLAFLATGCVGLDDSARVKKDKKDPQDTTEETDDPTRGPGNVGTQGTNAAPDADGDGVEDSLDCLPNDPTSNTMFKATVRATHGGNDDGNDDTVDCLSDIDDDWDGTANLLDADLWLWPVGDHGVVLASSGHVDDGDSVSAYICSAKGAQVDGMMRHYDADGNELWNTYGAWAGGKCDGAILIDDQVRTDGDGHLRIWLENGANGGVGWTLTF